MILEIKNQYMQVQINTIGSELWSIIDVEDEREHLWQGNKDVWPRRSPHLFPICGHLKDGKAQIEGQNYEIPLHGFARDYEHEVVEQQDHELTLLFTPNEETRKKYPYLFKLWTHYKLEGKKLACYLIVDNTDVKPIFFSIGYHTGFMCPLGEHTTSEACTLLFENNEQLNQLICTDEGLLTREKRSFLNNEKEIPLSHEVFPGSCILEGMTSKYIDLYDKQAHKKLRLGIAGFPYLVLWVNQTPAPFVCIEPWHGLPDYKEDNRSFESKQGICSIAPGEKFKCVQTIEILSEKE